MQRKNLALRVLSTAAMMSIVTSIAAPAFAGTYYLGDFAGSEFKVEVDESGNVTVNGAKDTTDVVIRGGTAADYAPAAPAPTAGGAEGGSAAAEEASAGAEGTTGEGTSAAGEAKGGSAAAEEASAGTEGTTGKGTSAAGGAEGSSAPAAPAKGAASDEDMPAPTPAPTAEGGPAAPGENPTVPAEKPDTTMKDTTPKAAPGNPTSDAVDKVIKVTNNWVDAAQKAFKLTLENVNIFNKDENKAAMTIEGKGNTTIELDGNNRLENSSRDADGQYIYNDFHAALEKSGDKDKTGTLTITDTDDIGGEFNKRGSLTAVSPHGAGIGGGPEESGDNITIGGNAYVSASGRHVGIGGGVNWNGYVNQKGTDGNNITIQDNAYVSAKGSERGIGGDFVANKGESTVGGSANNIHITGNSTVYAEGGIGGSNTNLKGGGDTKNLLIDGNSTVYAWKKDHFFDITGGQNGGAVIGSGYGGETGITITENAKVKAWCKGNDTSSSVGIGGYGGKTNVTIGGNAVIGDGNRTIGISGGRPSNHEAGPDPEVNVTIQDNATVGELCEGAAIGSIYGDGTSGGIPVNITLKNNALVKKVSKIGTTEGKAIIKLLDNVTVKKIMGSVWNDNAIGSRYSGTEITIGGSSTAGQPQEGKVTIDAEGGCRSVIGAGYGPDSTVTIGGNVDLTLKAYDDNNHFIVKSTSGDGTSYTNQELRKMMEDSGAKKSTIKLLDKDGKPLRILHTTDLCTPEIDAEGHEVLISYQAPTCTEKGYKTYVCGYEENHGVATQDPEHKEHTEMLPALGHDWSEWEVTTPATCTKEGVETHHCQRAGCTESETRKIAKDSNNHTGHGTYIKDDAAPTCTKDGYTGDTYCDGCNQKIKDGTVIPALGHTWTDNGNDSTHICTKDNVTEDHSYSEWTTVTPATCTTAGQKQRTCTECGHVETQEIPATGHHWVDNGDGTHGCNNPGCTEKHPHNWVDNGNGTHTCTDCGATEALPSKVLPADTNSALELRVVDAKGMDQPFTVSQNGTLRTYTGAYDTATLTGDLDTLRYLQDHGAQTIQFVTNGQTSSFAINDLLAQGSGSEVFYLTHRGAEEPTLLLVEADHSELVKD